jgi:riboflavin synthase
MFTGIIFSIGKYKELKKKKGFYSLEIEILEIDDPHIGESIAIDGICLTLSGFKEHSFFFDVSAETVSRTTLAKKCADSIVNIERSLVVGSRLSGHFVYGHIDCIGKVEGIYHYPSNNIYRFSTKIGGEYIVEKGSIAINGISLTISKVVSPGLFEVSVIPETLKNTGIQLMKRGDPVNIEYDMMVKYIKKIVKNVRQN